MEHRHKNEPHHHEHHSSNGLSMAFWLNITFSIIEVIGGIFTNSTAIIADAFHDFMDAIAIGSAVLLEKISGKKRTSKFSYGYKRFSLLSAIGMSVFLLTGAILMVISAVNSFITPHEVNSMGMVWLAILGVTINGLAFIRIKKSNGSHHGHTHQGNHNSKAIMLHLLEDVLGWIAVLIGAIVIYFTNWYWIDPLLALGIAIFIGFNATRNLISATKIVLQSVPENINLEHLSNELTAIKGIESIHDLHLWSMDGNYHVGSLHVVVSSSSALSYTPVYSAILQIMDRYNIQHPTVQIETNINDCRLTTC